MKLLLPGIVILLLFSQCSRQSGNGGSNSNGADPQQTGIEQAASAHEGAFLSIENPRHDFGTVRIRNTPEIRIDFEFTNTGTEPLIILKTDVSCGCVSAEFPRDPILPGGKGIIKARVDTKNQEGSFNKTIFVKSNASNDVELLRIVGQVK